MDVYKNVCFFFLLIEFNLNLNTNLFYPLLNKIILFFFFFDILLHIFGYCSGKFQYLFIQYLHIFDVFIFTHFLRLIPRNMISSRKILM